MDNNGNIREEFALKQQKTSEKHLVALLPKTQQILKRWLTDSGKIPSDFLFTNKRKPNEPLTTRRYRQLVKQWAVYIYADTTKYGTHSLRRTKSSLLYKKTGNLKAVQEVLGQKNISSTVQYLDVDKRAALELAKGIEL